MDEDLLALALSLIFMSFRWRLHVLRETIASFRDSVKRNFITKFPGGVLLKNALGSSPGTDASAGPLDRSPVEFSKVRGIEARPESSATTTIPIVFIHGSNSSYLPYSLAQARASNPTCAIYLLGDSDNDWYPFLEHRDYHDYFSGAAAFAQIYRHYNTTGLRYELFNFQRWFILREFLDSNNLHECLYLDSDVMLYANAAEEVIKFDLVDFTLADRMSPCVFFLRRRVALDNFCEFLMRVYGKADRYHYDKMLFHFAARQRNSLAGGVCDMTTLDMFAEEHAGEVGEVAQVMGGSVFDPNINSPQPGFEMENGIKKIVWQDNLPYGQFLKNGKRIKFNSLHFQGSAKALMSKYLTTTGTSMTANN